jgi:hypothetical protein
MRHAFLYSKAGTRASTHHDTHCNLGIAGDTCASRTSSYISFSSIMQQTQAGHRRFTPCLAS